MQLEMLCRSFGGELRPFDAIEKGSIYDNIQQRLRLLILTQDNPEARRGTANFMQLEMLCSSENIRLFYAVGNVL